jgi:hypothetical protein
VPIIVPKSDITQSGPSRPKHRKSFVFNAPRRTRTFDPLIKSRPDEALPGIATMPQMPTEEALTHWLRTDSGVG